MWIFLTFIAFTGFVITYTWYQLRQEPLDSKDGYFLGGRSLSGVVIGGSLLLTNISTEHLIGMNGSAYKDGFLIIAWEVTSAIALVIGAIYFVPRYLKMGLTTIPEYLELRFSSLTRTIVALFLIISFVVTLLPIVLYTGALSFESLFDVSTLLDISKGQAIWLMVIAIGSIGSVYAVFGGLKAVAISDTINGYGLLIGGLLVPIFALWEIGAGNMWEGLQTVFDHAPEKFSVVGDSDSILPFEVLFTGMILNQLYFWCMNQSIIQRALGAKNLAEAQKGLLLAGAYKIIIPLVIILPGVIAFYYFGTDYYDDQDSVYPLLVKRILPDWMIGLFAAVVMGAVLSTFNSVLNSAATLFSVGIFKRHIQKGASEKRLVRIGKLTSASLAVAAIMVAPYVANAPAGLYTLMQQLNGIFFIPIISILLAGFFTRYVSAPGAIAGLFFGLTFYILTVFVFEWDLHYVHIWGVEFLLNVGVMFGVSAIFPNQNTFIETDQGVVSIEPWKYVKPVGLALCAITVLIYILMA